jgi:hypothetical protein
VRGNKMKIEYDSNNSGGSWWLKDSDWEALEKAGWKVKWKKNGRWLGALAMSAEKEFDTPADAIGEFERITGQDASDEGCNCCGAPHTFTWDGGSTSGNETAELLTGSRKMSYREALEQIAKKLR